MKKNLVCFFFFFWLWHSSSFLIHLSLLLLLLLFFFTCFTAFGMRNAFFYKLLASLLPLETFFPQGLAVCWSALHSHFFPFSSSSPFAFVYNTHTHECVCTCRPENCFFFYLGHGQQQARGPFFLILSFYPFFPPYFMCRYPKETHTRKRERSPGSSPPFLWLCYGVFLLRYG